MSLISNQPQYNMLWRIIEPGVVPTSKELGIGQIVFSPMAQGVLTGKYLPHEPAPKGSRGTDEKGGRAMISRWLDNESVLERVQQLRGIADDEGLTMGQLALAWVLSNDNVASAIAGASRPSQIVESAAAAGHPLSDETRGRIEAIS